MSDDRQGRFATVAAAVLASEETPGGPADRAERNAARDLGLAQRLAGLFEDVMWVGAAAPDGAPVRRVEATEGPGQLGSLASALCATAAERVLVLSDGLPRPSSDLLLALVAWPESDVVAPRPVAGAPLLGLYRRTSSLDCARRLLADGRRDPLELFDPLECELLEAEDLAILAPEASRAAEG